MRANNSTKYIKSVKKEFENFYEEVLELYKNINSSTTDLEEIKNKIKDLNNSINNNLNNEELKGIKTQINNILSQIDDIHINKFDKDMELITTTREYFYNSNNDVIKEVVSGDLEYTYEYLYDNKNISQVNIYDKNNIIIGSTKYSYDEFNNIKKIISKNAEILSIATASSRIKDLDNKLNYLISDELLNKINNLDNSKLLDYNKEIKDLYLKLSVLEKGLPNSNEMLKIPEMLEKLSNLEKIINNLDLSINYKTFCFKTFSDRNSYRVPTAINIKKCEVSLEGLELHYMCDYVEDGEYIKFLIPLLDDYEVSIKYN